MDWITVTAGSAAITIYDSMGKKTYAFETLSKAGLNQVVFDLTFLSSGLYYLTIETPGSKKKPLVFSGNSRYRSQITDYHLLPLTFHLFLTSVVPLVGTKEVTGFPIRLLTLTKTSIG